MDRNGSAANQRRPSPVTIGISDEPDEALAARVATDPAAFAELYRRYVTRIEQYCSYRLRDRDLAQDATSQIFLKALEGLRRKPIDRFASWLFSIAHNEVLNRYRQLNRQATIERVGPIASPDLSPEDIAVLHSESSELWNLLPLLTAGQQRVIELRLAGLTTLEIQDVLGRNRSWVGTTQHRALKRLRTLLDTGNGDGRTP